jgi:hypothetical protein
MLPDPLREPFGSKAMLPCHGRRQIANEFSDTPAVYLRLPAEGLYTRTIALPLEPPIRSRPIPRRTEPLQSSIPDPGRAVLLQPSSQRSRRTSKTPQKIIPSSQSVSVTIQAYQDRPAFPVCPLIPGADPLEQARDDRVSCGSRQGLPKRGRQSRQLGLGIVERLFQRCGLNRLLQRPQ